MRVRSAVDERVEPSDTTGSREKALPQDQNKELWPDFSARPGKSNVFTSPDEASLICVSVCSCVFLLDEIRLGKMGGSLNSSNLLISWDFLGLSELFCLY